MKRKKSKIKEAIGDTDSVHSRASAKKKASVQNSGEEIQQKLDIQDDGYQFGNKPELNLKKIYQYMLDTSEEEAPPIDIGIDDAEEPGEEE